MSNSLFGSLSQTLDALDVDVSQPQDGSKLEAIYEIVRAINARSAPQEVVDVLTAQLRPFIRFDSLFISLVRDGALEAIACSQTDNGFRAAHPVVYPDANLWPLVERGEMWSEDNWTSSHTEDDPVRAFINVPLRANKRSIGVLHLDAFVPRQWTLDELRLARLIGELIGGAVDGAELLREREEREREHAANLAVLRAIQEATSEGICLISPRGELVSYNRRFVELWRLDEQTEALHSEAGTMMSYVLEQLADPDEFLLKLTILFEEPTARAQDEVALSDGRVFERYSAPAIAPEMEEKASHNLGRVWTFSDITERKRAEHQLAHQAFYDTVTGLPNRIFFGERLKHALKNLSRTRHNLSVLFLDLDRFKVINDSLGHDMGDRLLVQVAARLRDSLRPNDIAARFGGDEFVVLLEDILAPEDATMVAERIATALNSPFHLDSHTIGVTASVGVVIVSDPDESPDNILRKADVAMYRAKHAGKGRYEVFSDSHARAAMEELQMELDLAVALKQNEFEVFYQPLVHLEQKRVRAFEALVRWRHPRRGVIAPDAFISIAEQSGLIVPLGDFVLREAIAQAKRWSDAYDFPILMHVNLSAHQLEGTKLVPSVSHMLSETGLPASQLIVEITESVLMSDPDNATHQLESLKKLGVGIAVDDFGTGYSSLAYLEIFPFDLLKIDRAFVARMDKSQTLVKAVAGLGQALGLEIAAEGIESQTQLEMLQSFGVGWAQGFLFSRPVQASQAEIFLQNNLEEMLP